MRWRATVSVVCFQYVEQNWRHNDCYKKYGVDGSRCSVRRYMSEVEAFCPLMKGANKKSFSWEVKKPAEEDRPMVRSTFRRFFLRSLEFLSKEWGKCLRSATISINAIG